MLILVHKVVYQHKWWYQYWGGSATVISKETRLTWGKRETCELLWDYRKPLHPHQWVDYMTNCGNIYIKALINVLNYHMCTWCMGPLNKHTNMPMTCEWQICQWLTLMPAKWYNTSHHKPQLLLLHHRYCHCQDFSKYTYIHDQVY